MANAEYFAALDLIDEGALETGWRIKQGDYGKSVIRIQILQNGEIVYDADNPPSIAFKRPDGKSVVGTMTASTGSNTYIYTIEGSELQIAGMVVMDVKYQGTSSRESTLSCRFMVVPDTISSDATPASVYVAGVTLEQVDEAVEKIETAVSTADEKAQEITDAGTEAVTNVNTAKTTALSEVEASSKTAESWAVGGTGTREGEDTNNAKYWCEQAQSQSGVGTGTLTIKQGSTTKGTFNANSDVDVEIDLDEGGSGGGTWGSITGTLSNQTDLQTALDAKATETEVSALKDDITHFQNEGYIGKNLLENNGTTTTSNGVTFTVNSNKSVTVNGTNTSSTSIARYDGCTGTIYLDKGTYIASVGADNSNFTFPLYTATDGTTWTQKGYATKDGYQFTLSEDACVRINIFVKASATVSNVTVYPMIRLATDTDSTYQPYIPSNSTLNEALSNIQGTSNAYSSSTSYAVGAVVLYNNAVWECISACSGQTPSDGTYWTKVSLASLSQYINDSREELLYSGTSQVSTISLSKAMTKFKKIRIEGYIAQVASSVIVDPTAQYFGLFFYSTAGYYITYKKASDTSYTINSTNEPSAGTYISKIYGIGKAQ